MEIGREIDQKAHLLFPGGVLIEEEPWQHAEAADRTAALMNDARVPAIFEAAFQYEDIRIRVDVLERLDGGAWGLREVKSSTGLKDHYLDDIALQAFVLKGVGVPVTSVELVHVNSTYLRGLDGICWADFFIRVDVGDPVAMRLGDLPGRLPALRDCLRMIDLPYAEPGQQCGSPYGCEFWDRCTADKPVDWIWHIPRLSQSRVSELKTRGIETISSIPDDFPLTPNQAVIRNVIKAGKPYVAPDLAGLLHACKPPACYLDFEAMMPPIPLYDGTRPYQTIPFQWSLHAITREGELSHQEFLADEHSDPRRRFLETLIEALVSSNCPIIVYSAYEETRLKELAEAFSDLSDRANDIIARLVDLLPAVRHGVYFPEFRFTNSIKSVAPALCPGFSYGDLGEIAHGAAASAAFLELASGHVTDIAKRAQLRSSLLAYCHRDTWAMVRLHQALNVLAAENTFN